MTNLEHIKELTRDDCPDWLCQQIADMLDSKDKKIKGLELMTETLKTTLQSKQKELNQAKECIQSLSW